MQYSFGRNDHRLEADNFDPTFHAVSFNAALQGTITRHNYWMMRIMKALPESMMIRMGPEAASFIILKRVRI